MPGNALDEVMGQSALLSIETTGTLAGDVARMHNLLDDALTDTVTGREFELLDRNDPIGTIGQLAVHLATLNSQLIAQGFHPPRVHYFDDPFAFLKENIAFLGSIAGHVREPQVTVH